MGDDLLAGTIWGTSEPVAALVAQVNRFGPAAPMGLQFASTPFQVASGNLDPAVAIAAVTIFQRRAAAAYEQFHDAGSLSAITRANNGFTDPVGFVTANLGEVTAAIAGYGDSLGLPPASTGSIIGDLGSNKLLIVAGVGVALWLLTRRRA